jgi:hypothetical protein
MDPYLEDPRRWPDVHLNLIAEMEAMLNRSLRPRYFASAEERVYICDEDDPARKVIVPDLRVTRHPGAPPASVSPARKTAGAALAVPVEMTTLIEEEIRERRLEIVDAETRGVVTVLEVASPSNKVLGSRGRASYQQKRQEVMQSRIHWVEIDLLRGGERLFARDVELEGDYFVHVSRVESRPRGLVWPILLEQRLPVVDIPLKKGDSDAQLDLQQALESVYERSAYDLKLDYRSDAVPPLSSEHAAWAGRLLSEKGLR